MTKLRCSSDEAIRALDSLGFSHDRTTGSHATFKKQTPGRTFVVTVVLGCKDLKPGTLSSIVRQSGVSRQDFVEALKA